MTPVFIDLETYYSPTHSLTKMSPLAYCMHPETEVISIAIKVGSYPTDVIFGEDKVRRALSRLDWSNKLVVGHNLSGFDGMILAWRLGVKPKAWACTLAMARPFFSKTCGNSLKKVSEELGLGAKLDFDAVNAKGKHLCDFTPAELVKMEEYNRQDTELCAKIFHRLLPRIGIRELHLIDMTIRMLLEPAFVLDYGLLEDTLQGEKVRKQQMLLNIANMLGVEDEEAARAMLASAPKFKAFLESQGVPVPMKVSKTTGLPAPALAKTDEEFLDLREHENPLVAAATKARLGVKSTILETRIEAFLIAGDACEGLLPVPLHYCGAGTGRWTGWSYNPQNLPRIDPKTHKPSDALRKAMLAPAGHKVIVADLSGIELRVNHFLWKVPSSMALFRADPEKADLYNDFAAFQLYMVALEEVTKQQRQVGKVCIAEGSLVLTDVGLVPIEQVTDRHRVWDGVEWVYTLGAIYQGEKEVITYEEVTATPDHIVYLRDGSAVELAHAAEKKLSLARTGNGREAVRVGEDFRNHDLPRQTQEPVQTKGRVWDILNAGPRRRFTVDNRLVSNCHLGLGFGSGAPTFVKVAKVMGGIDLSLDESKTLVYKWRNTYKEIVAGWKTCHGALAWIHDGEQRAIDPWGLCVTSKEGIHLPRGRVIAYPGLHQEVGEDNKQEWWCGLGRMRSRVYGPLVDENCVQALARDAIADNALEFKKRTGLLPKLMVHDELVYVVPEREAEPMLAELQSIMRTPPTWWPELVTWSEGDIADTYGDAK